jgi:hypothetical protein
MKKELRMYGLVPYNISPIQQGIQFGHAVVEYGRSFGDNEEYKDWADNWKTFIILNGGTTNFNIDLPGTLNQHLINIDIDLCLNRAAFYEPDLGDQLTAIVFIVDERVFNKEKYPDFRDYMYHNHPNVDIRNLNKDNKWHHQWTKSLGGEHIIKIREFLSKFKLA